MIKQFLKYIFCVIPTLLGTHESFSQDFVTDTVILINKFEVEADSISSYKRNKDFAYIHYLDSLLRKTKGLTVDTINLLNATPGKRNSTTQPQRDEKVYSPPDNRFLNSLLVRIIFWMLAIGFILFILYKLFLGDGFFRRNKSVADRSLQDEELSADPSAYERLITDAVNKRDFRLATRYQFIQTLQKLSHAGIINYAPDKTNYQYVTELSKRNLQNEFASLSLSYEYVWYGQFNITEPQYSRIKNEYNLFHQKI